MSLRVPAAMLVVVCALGGCAAEPEGAPTSYRAVEVVGGTPLSVRVSVDVYLPEGMGTGRPAHARVELDGRDQVLCSGVVGDELCAREDCSVRVTSESCVTFAASELRLEWGALFSTTRAEELCASTDAVRGNVTVAPVPLLDSVAPLQELRVLSAVPIDIASLASARVLVGGRAIPARYVGDAWLGRLELLEPVAPFGEIEADLAGVRDAVGREMGVVAAPFGLTDTIDDLSLDIAPRFGAIVAVRTVVSWDREQGLAVPSIGRGGSGEMAVLVGLGEVPGRTLEVEATPQLSEGGPLVACALRGLLLGACEALELSVSLEIPPGDGPLALVIGRSEGSRSAVSISQISVQP